MFKEYIKTKKNEIIIIFSIFVLNYLIMFLSVGVYENYWYTIFLFLFFYLIYFLWAYFKFKEKFKYIVNINEDNIADILPKDILDESYIKKITNLIKEKNELNSIREKELDRLEEDYSIWIHQAKTPISALSLIIDSMDSELKDDMKQELFKINQYTEMALTNIRLQDINKDLEIETHDLYDLVKNTVRKYALYFNYKGNRLVLEDFKRKIVTDEKWFAYALDQVISNAVKYTRNGEVKIFVSDEYLVVEDTGIGIKEEDIPRLFTRGFTGYTGRVKKKATGLGLYMSKKILTTLGSGIHLESKVGEGTKVYIKITEDL
ncbi:MAG: HAMP domain-containing sensor histidine kinase [Miniphocaeibacter sp.]|uniref:sensor histidine kinase n=1 Tax=Miniphocaeibacter sp. TaxID=3100973 RepID=UPI00182DD5AC|nr:HAMP domain-containing histidine kinase [Gallicola sp.]